MKGYLLLRDNKQTGPYTSEEIIAKGFKPYDLIWAEGKSAGWRYPGELLEFVPYAPMVEEQPFDRFFKKPSSVDNKPVISPIETIAPNKKEPSVSSSVNTISEQSSAKVISLPSRKIFVTLPGTTTTPKPLPAVSKPASTGQVIPTPVSEKEKVIVTESAKLENRKNPLPENQKSSYSSFQQTSQFIQDKLEPHAWEEKLYNQPVIVKMNSTRTLLMGAVAACLLLGGVIIGLMISNTNQSSEKKQLASLVQQIQQRETSKKQSPDQAMVLPTKQDEQIQGQERISEKQDDQKRDPEIIKRVVNKEPARVEEKEAKKDVSAMHIDKTPVTDKPDIEKTITETNKNQETESARQKIYSLVSVEGSSYKTGVLGGISNLALTISNNSLYPIDQVEVIVNYMNIEKRVVRKETVVINDVAAGEQKTIPVPKSNRGVSVSYSISKINSRALGLAKSSL